MRVRRPACLRVCELACPRGHVIAGAAYAECLDAMEFAELHRQMIGPVRGSRTNAHVADPAKPNVLCVGAVDDGAGLSGDVALACVPRLLAQRSGSFGTDASSPSNPGVFDVDGVVRRDAISDARLAARYRRLTRARLQPIAIPD